MRFIETIEVRSNLILTFRERGKIVARREGHNIWVNLGREYLASLIAYSSFSPVARENDNGLRYMGLGIGGTQQLALSTANSSPVGDAYAGTNAQTDTVPTVTRLERPVRVSGSGDPYPGQFADVWLGQVQAPAEHPTATQTVLRRLFIELEVSYSPFLSVPLSEAGLFSGGANPNVFNNTLVAYDTFDTVSKTAAFDAEIEWTIRF